MRDKLPMLLSTGVTATIEGLVIDVRRGDVYGLIREWNFSVHVRQEPPEGLLVSWPEAAERLRYREGEPWSLVAKSDSTEIMSGNDHWACMKEDFPILYRLASIICDDAESFRVLHWCLENLP